MGEAFGAVDWIDDPGTAARAVTVGFFFADDCVGRKGLADLLTQVSFGGFVGFGDGRAIVLGLERNSASVEPLAGKRACAGSSKSSVSAAVDATLSTE